MKLHRLGALAALLMATGASAQTLEVQLTGVAHDRGNLKVSLYVEPKTFRKEKQALAVRQLPAKAGSVLVSFEGLEPGTYAVMAYHDEDGDGALNRRFGMIPTEGYGLSNDPDVFGPPAFEDSAFSVGEGAPQRIEIPLHY